VPQTNEKNYLLCGMNKKHKMGLTNPTPEEVKQWVEE
jgi:lysyl-tRNA synthetase class 2